MRAELFALVRRPTAWAFVAITPAYTLLNGYLMQYLLFKTANPGTFANLSADQILPTMLPANFVTVTLDDLGSSPNYDGPCRCSCSAPRRRQQLGLRHHPHRCPPRRRPRPHRHRASVGGPTAARRQRRRHLRGLRSGGDRPRPHPWWYHGNHAPDRNDDPS